MNMNFKKFHRVSYNPSARHTAASILHYKDGEILSASTQELAIKTRLHRFIPIFWYYFWLETSANCRSCCDVSASENIGRILAHRCLKSGIYFACKDVSDAEISDSSDKVSKTSFET